MRRKVRPMIDTEMFSNASIIAADSGPHVCADDLLPRCFPNYLQTTSPVRRLLRRSEVITRHSPRIGSLGTCDGGEVSVRKMVFNGYFFFPTSPRLLGNDTCG